MRARAGWICTPGSEPATLYGEPQVDFVDGRGEYQTVGGVAGPEEVEERVDAEKVEEGVDGTSTKWTCLPGIVANAGAG